MCKCIGYPGSKLVDQGYNAALPYTMYCSQPALVTAPQQTLSALGVTWNRLQDDSYGDLSYNSDIAMTAALYSVDVDDTLYMVAAASQGQPFTFPGHDNSSSTPVGYSAEVEFDYFRVADFAPVAPFTGQLDAATRYSACVASSELYALYVGFAQYGSYALPDQLPNSSLALPASLTLNATDDSASMYVGTVWFETVVHSPTNPYGLGFPQDTSSVFTELGAAGEALVCSASETVHSDGETLTALGVTWNPLAGDAYAYTAFSSDITLLAGLYAVNATGDVFTLLAAGNRGQPIAFPGFDPALPSPSNVSHFAIADFAFVAPFTGVLHASTHYAVCVAGSEAWALYKGFGGDDQYEATYYAPALNGLLPDLFNATLDLHHAGLWFETNSSTSSPAPAPGSVQGDPQFVGLLGQRYQVHGVDGSVYNLISAPTLQVNARFVFLASGVCPSVDGVVVSAVSCWSHAGSYIGSMAVQQRGEDGQVHSVILRAGAATAGFASVLVNGARLSVGESATAGALSLDYTSTHTVALHTPLFAVQLHSSDRFVNMQQLAARVPLSTLAAQKVHGLLGQTHTRRMYAGSEVRYVEGAVDDYALDGDELLGSGFVYNRFEQ